MAAAAWRNALTGIDLRHRHHQEGEHQDGEGSDRRHRNSAISWLSRVPSNARVGLAAALRLIAPSPAGGSPGCIHELGDLELLAGEMPLVAGAILQGQPLQPLLSAVTCPSLATTTDGVGPPARCSTKIFCSLGPLVVQILDVGHQAPLVELHEAAGLQERDTGSALNRRSPGTPRSLAWGRPSRC